MFADPDPLRLEARAELHRVDSHPWVRRGRVHRTALEPHEEAEVEAQVVEALRQRAILAANTKEGKSRYDRSGR